MFGPLHERAECQVIVYSYTKLTLLTVLLVLPHHLSHKKILCARELPGWIEIMNIQSIH